MWVIKVSEEEQVPEKKEGWKVLAAVSAIVPLVLLLKKKRRYGGRLRRW